MGRARPLSGWEIVKTCTHLGAFDLNIRAGTPPFLALCERCAEVAATALRLQVELGRMAQDDTDKPKSAARLLYTISGDTIALTDPALRQEKRRVYNTNYVRKRRAARYQEGK